MAPAGASKCGAMISGPLNTNTLGYSHRYKDTQGTLFYNSASLNGQPVYAAAYMIQSSPSMLCPYYNDTISYRSSTGLAYYVVCGGQYSNGIDVTGGGSTTSKLSELMCYRNCFVLKSALTQARSCGMHCRVVSSKMPREPDVSPLTKLP